MSQPLPSAAIRSLIEYSLFRVEHISYRDVLPLQPVCPNGQWMSGAFSMTHRQAQRSGLIGMWRAITV
jgi:hypothetical protein